MNGGVRALGVVESAAGDRRATVAGAVVRADRTFDDLVLDSWTVGGTDATRTVIDCWQRLGREDVRYLLVAGIAPAWFNVLDLHAIHEVVVAFTPEGGRPEPVRVARLAARAGDDFARRGRD